MAVHGSREILPAPSPRHPCGCGCECEHPAPRQNVMKDKRTTPSRDKMADTPARREPVTTQEA